jgi:hypothetical protein
MLHPHPHAQGALAFSQVSQGEGVETAQRDLSISFPLLESFAKRNEG